MYSGLLSEIAQCSGVRTPEERGRDSGDRETTGIPLDAEIFAPGRQELSKVCMYVCMYVCVIISMYVVVITITITITGTALVLLLL